jgi:uncharacterized OsmC-like protein
VITVSGAKHQVDFAVDGSLMNPLEAFYAALAGCASVFAKKACKELGVPPEGIEIRCQPYAGAKGPMSLSRFRTDVTFPASFSAEQKSKVLDAIEQCAVKKIVEAGQDVSFTVCEM